MSASPPTPPSERLEGGGRIVRALSAMLFPLLLLACGADVPQPSQSAPAADAVQADEPESEARAAEPAAPAAPEPAAERAYDAPTEQPAFYGLRVVRTYPHDRASFTQGLFFADGALFESTGKRGASRIRRLDLRTGDALAEVSLPDEVFGEGATVVGDRIVSLSWREGLGFVHDLATLEQEGTFPLEGEGWGLAYDEVAERLILSDGTDTLRFLNPETFEETGSVAVTLGDRPLPQLNELEWVDGEVWANVWQQEAIVRIDPETGAVRGVVDVSGLYPPQDRADPRDDVPNGIAYEPRSGRLFLTGKRWPQIFEVELDPRG